MKTPSFTAMTICCWLLSLASSIAQDLKEAESHYANGNKLYKENKYQEAIDLIEKALAIYERQKNIPGQIKARNLKGECLANMGQCDKAIELIRESLTQARAELSGDHPELANTYYYLSRANGGCARKNDEAIKLMHQSTALKKKLYGPNSLEVSDDYNFMGYLFANKDRSDSAFAYLDKALAIRKKELPPDDIEIAHTLYFLARVYENQSELSKALELNLQSYAIRRSKFTEDNPTISNSLTAIGTVYQKFGNYDRALDYFQRALEIRKKTLGDQHSNVAGSYYNIGNVYNSMLNYHSALQYYRQGNQITENSLGVNSDLFPTYLAVTGKMYGLVGEHEKAVEYIGNAKTLAEKNLSKDHPFLGIVYGFAGDYYAEINDFSAHINYSNKAIAIFRKAYGPGSAREADILAKMGSSSAKNKRFDEAITFYDQALAIYESKMGKQNPKTASMHHALGAVFSDQQRFDEALVSYQKAFACISAGRKDTTGLYPNPRPDELESKSLALKIADSKGKTFFEKSAFGKKDLSALKQSLATYQFAVNLIDQINAEYKIESAKITLENESRKIYSMALRIAHQLYALTKDQAFLDEAFIISEKSKSALLSENLRDVRAKTIAGVPDSLIAAENDIKVELAFYQNGMYQARKANEPDKIRMYERNIFETQQKYNLLKEKLEKRFPAYFNIKYNLKVMDIATVRDLLPDENTAVIEFFTDDSSVFIFSMTKNSARLEQRKRGAALEEVFHNYRKSLTDADFILNFRKEADELYTQSAYSLYDFLLKPIFEAGEKSIQKLIIIPDDVLAQLNFGTLLTKKTDSENHEYKTLEYLIQKYQISYAYSAAFIRNEPVRSKRSIHSFAGFAPSYSGNQFANLDTVLHSMTYLVVRNGNLPLPGAEEEVRHISEFMKGKSWLRENATETNFKKHAGDYAILHLAMHSLLNNENPEYSELLFHEEKDLRNDGFLKVSEIYNLNLNADLVVLSACSSGYGQIQKGEGPISISRAFSYAGCPSVVMSLWKVPDDVTRQIMTFFYEELMNVKEKDEALRLAQLKFLSETKDPLYHHPYFWAGFVVMGDTGPVTSSPWPVWIFIITMLIVSAVVFRLRKRRNVHSSSSRS